MTVSRRHLLIATAALPAAGCALQPLPPLDRRPLDAAAGDAVLRAPAVGQRWRYRRLNAFNSAVTDEIVETVSAAGAMHERAVIDRRSALSGQALPAEIHAGWGRVQREAVWDYPLNLEQPLALWVTDPQRPGRRPTEHTRYRMDGGSFAFWIQSSLVAAGRERVSVPAGTFDTWRVDRLIRLQHDDHSRATTTRDDTLWWAPALGRWVARETRGRYRVPSDGPGWGSELLEDHARWVLLDAT